MSPNAFISLHETTGATFSDWRALGDTHSCTVTVTHEDGDQMSFVLFSKTPFDIQRDAHGASQVTSND